jgi:starch synthase (maltosyl-transferring)
MATRKNNNTDSRQRAIIEGVTPIVDCGRFPVKRCVGDRITVSADVFVDGHDLPRALLLYRKRGERSWQQVDMEFLNNDRWQAQFGLPDLGVYEYTITGWADEFRTWRHDVQRWTEPEDIEVSLAVGAQIIAAAAKRARGPEAKRLKSWSERLVSPSADLAQRHALALDPELTALIEAYPYRGQASTFEPVLNVVVDPRRAAFSTWYELFPRATASGRHATFSDVEARLPYVAEMGFDVLYFPPIHPIGLTKRKGPNNSTESRAGDPGSPWAIGGREGGHKSIHPELGSPEDFRRLVRAARLRGMEIALDIAFQVSPDHPYVKEHPEWFKHRPDGSIQYAENPPKKYQDIYPFNFETEQWSELWDELKSIFLHWIGEGVLVFRVDNPHTKPFPMWQWLIGEIKEQHPEVIFLSEAFTRPKIMHRLAKLGFSQSYTYFTWRNHKVELIEYFTELSQSPSREYFRPNVWPNTPDILHEFLQTGGRPAFVIRLLLAATLAANYGIYGPAFELLEHVPLRPGSEEYLHSEKYEIRNWDIERQDSLQHLIGRVNRIRRDNPALQSDWRLRFHAADSEHILCYSKTTEDFSNVMLVTINIHPRDVHWAWVDLDLKELGLDPDRPFEAHDLLTGARYTWEGTRSYVRLDPRVMPAHVFRLTQEPA